MFIAIAFSERNRITDSFERKTEVSARELTEHHVDAYRMILTGIKAVRIVFHQAAIS